MSECAYREYVERHFSGDISPLDERVMRAHLGDCQACRRYYERLLVGARLDPRALSPQERLGRGLGLLPSPRRSPRILHFAAAALAACLALMLARAVSPGGAERGFSARGGALTAGNELLAYRVRAGRLPERLRPGGHIRADDELSFAYRNPAGHARLAIFALDGGERVYWYHPAWIDPAANPTAIAIAPAASPVELGEAIAQPLVGPRLRIFALFTGSALTVREIEALAHTPHRLEGLLRDGHAVALELEIDR